MSALNAHGRQLKRADPTTIQDKFMVGYQGWFTCAGDGKPLDPHHHGWLHWITHPLPDGGRPNTDLWPDMSEYGDDELYPVPGLHMKNGEQARLFSSRHPKTVRRHFNWMAQHSVDGVFLQRFLGQCDVEGGSHVRDQRDEIGDRVREAAEAEGRVFSIMYDVSGVSADRVEQVIKDDWIHLVRHRRILDSPNYLREKGKPVLALWGFGFSDRGYTVHQVRGIIAFIRDNTPGGIYLIGGVPAHWRTSVSDAVPDPEFVQLWLNEVDCLCPWTIGRYSNEDEADNFADEKIKGDLRALKHKNDDNERRGDGKRMDYMPVVFPGGSGFNLSEGQWSFNGIKRNGGRFLWRQIWNARRQGVRIIYGAMWDEYDEGTAFLPVVAHKRLLPQSDKWPFLSLDEEGHDLPTDWYMRIAGFAAEGLRSERMIHEAFPVKELQDYWARRPRYEEPAAASASGSAPDSGSAPQALQDWETAQGSKPPGDEPPPPPYSLEASAAAASTPTQPIQQAAAPDAVSGLATTLAHTSISPTPTGYVPPPQPQAQALYAPPAQPQAPGSSHTGYPVYNPTTSPLVQAGVQAPHHSPPAASTTPAWPPTGWSAGPSGASNQTPHSPPAQGGYVPSSYGPSSQISHSPPAQSGYVPSSYGAPATGALNTGHGSQVTSPVDAGPPWSGYGADNKHQRPVGSPAAPGSLYYNPPAGGVYPQPSVPNFSPPQSGPYSPPAGPPGGVHSPYPPPGGSPYGGVQQQHTGGAHGMHPSGYQPTAYGHGQPQQPHGVPGGSYGYPLAASPPPGTGYGPPGGISPPAHNPYGHPNAPNVPGVGAYPGHGPYSQPSIPGPQQPYNHAPPHTGGLMHSPPGSYFPPGSQTTPPTTYPNYGPTPNAMTRPPGTGVGPAPPLPARPGSQSGSGSYNYYAGGPASGSGTPSAGPINLTSAFNTVERFTGKDTRQQLEKGVDGLVRGGSKLFSKFAK